MAAWVLLIFLVFFVSAIQTALNIANINSTEHYCHSGMQHKSDILGEYEIFLATLQSSNNWNPKKRHGPSAGHEHLQCTLMRTLMHKLIHTLINSVSMYLVTIRRKLTQHVPLTIIGIKEISYKWERGAADDQAHMYGTDDEQIHNTFRQSTSSEKIEMKHQPCKLWLACGHEWRVCQGCCTPHFAHHGSQLACIAQTSSSARLRPGLPPPDPSLQLSTTNGRPPVHVWILFVYQSSAQQEREDKGGDGLAWFVRSPA